MKFKKLAILLLSIMLLFTSCVKDSSAEEGFTVIGLNFPSFDLLRTLTEGTDTKVSMLLPLGSESHSYEPTPQDVIKLSKTGLFVYTGGESDEWVKGVLNTLDNPINTFILIDEVPSINEAVSEGMEKKGDDEIDEHVWTSLSNEKALALSLSEKLSTLDSENSDVYRANAESYTFKLDKLTSEYEEVIKKGKRNVLVFADRFPLSHFVHEFNLDFYAAFPGCAHESEASAKTVAFLIDKVKEEHIPVVFHIELSDEKLAKMISAETGAVVREWNTAHNVTKKQFEEGITYLDLMKANLSILKEALD